MLFFKIMLALRSVVKEKKAEIDPTSTTTNSSSEQNPNKQTKAQLIQSMSDLLPLLTSIGAAQTPEAVARNKAATITHKKREQIK